MTAGDNPPIGILLCTGVGKETAEYLAPFTDPQLFLSEYQLQLPAKERFTEFLKKENEGLQASVGKGVVKSGVKILELLKEFPEMTRERLAAEVGLSVRGVEKNLAQLKAAGKIRRIGGRKGGHWEVVKGGGK